MSTTEQYKPGDQANGYVLAENGQWVPVAPVEQPKKKRTGRKVAAGIAVAVAGIAIASQAGGSDGGTVTDRGSATVTSQDAAPSEGSAPSEDAVVESSAPEPEPVDTTAKVGDTVDIGDWSVRVTKVNLNADAVIHQANMFNDKPKHHYVLVTWDATYQGDERTGDASALTWTATNAANKMFDDTYAVVPMDNDNGIRTETRKGGTVTYQTAFDMDTPTIISVEDGWSLEDDAYADFAL